MGQYSDLFCPSRIVTSPHSRLMAEAIVSHGVFQIRDVPSTPAELKNPDLPEERRPISYTSGYYGPLYASIRELIGARRVFDMLSAHLASSVFGTVWKKDVFLCGNVTGGMSVAQELANDITRLTGRQCEFTGMHKKAKEVGTKQRAIGLNKNPRIAAKSQGIVVDELLNFGETTASTVEFLREHGYTVNRVFTFVAYDHPPLLQKLEELDLVAHTVVTASDLVSAYAAASSSHDEATAEHIESLAASAREFLKDPLTWQERRGLKRVVK